MQLDQELESYERISDEDLVTLNDPPEEDVEEEDLEEEDDFNEEGKLISNQSFNETFTQVLTRRVERRAFLKGATVTASLLVASVALPEEKAEAAQQGLAFTPVQLSTEDRVIVPPRWRHALGHDHHRRGKFQSVFRQPERPAFE